MKPDESIRVARGLWLWSAWVFILTPLLATLIPGDEPTGNRALVLQVVGIAMLLRAKGTKP